MPRFAANVSMMFPDVPVEARFRAARDLGFTAVEYLFPYAQSPAEVKAGVCEAGVAMILLNTPLGDAAKGERGLAAVPGREADFRRDFDRAMAYAVDVGVPMIHVMAGVVDHADRDAAAAVLVRNVRAAADLAASHSIDVLLEPLNTEDTPGYFLTRTDETRQLIDAIERDNVRLQFDFYHRQIMEGNLERRLEENLDVIGHIQFSSVPGRHEPQHGEVNMAYLFAACDRLGYDGWVGCEYRPKTTVREGLSWAAAYGLGA